MGFFFHHLRGETKKVIIRLPLGSFRRFQLKSMNYSGYSFELKMTIIHEYLKGKGGYPYLAKKYGIKSMGQVRYWVKSYQEFGKEGLLRKRQNQSYSGQFKMDR